MPSVNPHILKWARETAGLSIEDAAAKLDIGEARGVTGEDRLAAYEAGEYEPSRPLLVRMVKCKQRTTVLLGQSASETCPRVSTTRRAKEATALSRALSALPSRALRMPSGDRPAPLPPTVCAERQ